MHGTARPGTYVRAVSDEGSGVVVVLHLGFERRVLCKVRRVELGVDVLE